MKTASIENHHGNRNEGGYTLLEVLMAISIFMVGLLAIGSMQTRALLGNATSRDITEAVNIAMRTAEDLMAISWDTTNKDSRLDPDATHTPKNFDTEHEKYEVLVDPVYITDEDYGPTDEEALKITITVKWPRGLDEEDQQSINYTLFRTESI